MIRFTRALGTALGLIFVSGLTGCGDSQPTILSTTDFQALCLDESCGTPTRLLSIPDAENLLFADDGQLFVSGGENVYAVIRTDTGYAALPLYAGQPISPAWPSHATRCTPTASTADCTPRR